MPKYLLVWKYFPFYVAALVATLTGVGIWQRGVVESHAREALRSDLDGYAVLMQDAIRSNFSHKESATCNISSRDLVVWCERFSNDLHIGVQLISLEGVNLYGSKHAPADNSKALSQPDMADALSGHAWNGVLNFDGNGGRYVAKTFPVMQAGTTVAVVRLLAPWESVQAAKSVVTDYLMLVGILLLGTGVAWIQLTSHRLSQEVDMLSQSLHELECSDPIESMEEGSLPRSVELSELADDVIMLVRRTLSRTNTIQRQHSEQAAVLESMSEGVLAIDSWHKIISINDSGASSLSTSPVIAKGRLLTDVVSNAKFLEFVYRTVNSSTPLEEDIVLSKEPLRITQAHGTALLDEQGNTCGAVVVMTDVTHLRRLENMRRDFVANVSHELKTPITSIKGFVETLLDGAMDQRDDAEKFLGIISQQSDRLNAIIEDLLSLSKIEQEETAGDIELHLEPLGNVLAAAVHQVRMKADKKQIAIRIECSSNQLARINSPLLEQAIVNLLDNAIKYSEPRQEVLLACMDENKHIVIKTTDHGCGIAPQHHARLFERFYRVDRARSRKLGGTGLGLAIVKHITHAHAGRVKIESIPGYGSTFSIYLPRPTSAG